MARWAYVVVPVGAALLIGAWWATDQALGTPDSDLGPSVVVSPHPGAPSSTPQPGPVQTVSPAPPPPAGDDDPDDDADDTDDADDADDDAD